MGSDEVVDRAAVDRAPVVEGGPTTAFEQQAQVDAKRFRVVAIVAGALLAPQALSHLVLPWFMTPAFSGMYGSMGGSLPPTTALIVTAGPWLGLLLAIVDGAVFWGFYRLARKYWIGLLFAPLFLTGIPTGLVVAALYLPMFQIITLVE